MMACDAPEVDPLDNLVLSKRAGVGNWINNGLHLPEVSGIDPAHPLSTPQGMSETSGVLADPSTLIAAQYLVECALPMGASIVKHVDGDALVLGGHLGLAPEWEDGSCDEDCQQWVSACMLARTNTSDQTVVISLHADHPSIGTATHPAYPIYEASYFGNLFSASAPRYICTGSAEATAQAELAGRTCSVDPESCDFEEFDDCFQLPRCGAIFDDGDPTAVDCVAEGDPMPYNTITAYIKVTDEDED